MIKLLLAISLSTSLIMMTPMAAQAKTFTAPDDVYTAQYPGGCKTEKGDNRFSDTLTLECKGDAGIQLENDDIFREQLTGDTDDGMIDTLLTTIDTMWDNVEEVERGTNKYVINNKTAPYLIATYDQEFTTFFGLPSDSQEWAVMIIAIKIGNGDYVIGQYRNTQDDFDKELPLAVKIFKSVEGKGASNEDDDITQTTTSQKIECFDNEKVEALGKLIGKEIDCA